MKSESVSEYRRNTQFLHFWPNSENALWHSRRTLEFQRIQGRKVSGSDIAQIAGLIKAHPEWSRWRLSRVLAERWQWHAVSGQLKDMADRSLLLKLHHRGLIALPDADRWGDTF